MIIEDGKFYFIKDEFFDIFKDYKLMQNKESGNKRPCYFCFNDEHDSKIIWFVPISSKVQKYKKIYNSKIKRKKVVDNFVFGEVLGNEKVFLIQNIFPTTEKFIENKYRSKNKDVRISDNLQDEVIRVSKKVIELSKIGINVPFYDINKMKRILIEKYVK